MFSSLIIILGLIVFETVNSIDNAIVNAYVLKTMSEKWQKIFLFWGIITAVFIIRGLLPLLVVWLSVPELGFMGAVKAMFSLDLTVAQLIKSRKSILLLVAMFFYNVWL